MHRHAMASSSSSLNHLLLFLLITLSFSLSLYNSSSSSAAIADDSNLKHAHVTSRRDSFLLSTHKDTLRVQSLFSRISTAAKKTKKKKNYIDDHDDQDNYLELSAAAAAAAGKKKQQQQLIATLESGVSLGSGEYLMDVFIGTPPRHFSLILDTGSDLNWLQCAPCRDCFHQHGPLYDPNLSTTYRNLTCTDHRCALVEYSPPDINTTTDPPCSTCQYFYWYGDQSNTTGDLAAETFTVNLTSGAGGATEESHLLVDGVVFGCGHWNRGLFRGAAGVLGLGRGPLSFASQMRSLYGHHTFSYCLVDRNSDLLVSSKLIFSGGEGEGEGDMNYTSFADGGGNKDGGTFYYVRVKGVRVGGEVVDSVPPESWEVAEDGTGGTIIDSGTTLSYFVGSAYRAIRDAFARKVTYPLVEEDFFPVLNPCYNVSGVEEVVMPGFGFEFADGAVWDFPAENYFIRLEPESIVCLAFLETPRRSSPLSIIGNYQQQNFRILYDTSRSRLGFAPTNCSQLQL